MCAKACSFNRLLCNKWLWIPVRHTELEINNYLESTCKCVTQAGLESFTVANSEAIKAIVHVACLLLCDVQGPGGPVVTSDSSLTYLSCYFQVREIIAVNSQISIREVAVFPVMKMDRHVCLFCWRFVSPFPSYLLFTTKEVACRFHTLDGENIVERPQFCAPLWLHNSCLLCVWERNVWIMCVLFSPCLSVRPSVTWNNSRTAE